MTTMQWNGHTILAMLDPQLNNLFVRESGLGVDLEMVQDSLYRLSKGTLHGN
jgi:hypothetical protein